MKITKRQLNKMGLNQLVLLKYLLLIKDTPKFESLKQYDEEFKRIDDLNLQKNKKGIFVYYWNNYDLYDIGTLLIKIQDAIDNLIMV